METCFANLVEPGDKVIVCQNGVFGGRMKENVERCGGIAVLVEDAWGEAIDAGKDVKKLPMSLGEALDHLEANEVVKKGMPGEMYRLYDEYKRDEYARFMSTVTEWDNETYMECLP